MIRLFAQSDTLAMDKIIIRDKQQLHHIKDVLRIDSGGEVEVFDEKGSVYRGVIEKISRSEALIKINSSRKHIFQDKDIKLTIACAIPKKSKMEDIVDKLTQLGVQKIIPMRTGRVVVKLDSRKEKARLERWQRVALNATRQCQGCSLPVISPIKSLEDVLAESKGYDLKLIPALIGKRTGLKTAVGGREAKDILILIGPEGDFTPGEVDAAVRAGFIPVSLGERVLRVETAAVAVVSFIRLYAGH